MNERKSASRAMVLPTARLYFLRTYERCCAYSASYGRPFLFFCVSYQMTLFGRSSASPMSCREYFFANSICISSRSLFVKCVPLEVFSFAQCIKSFEFKRLVALCLPAEMGDEKSPTQAENLNRDGARTLPSLDHERS